MIKKEQKSGKTDILQLTKISNIREDSDVKSLNSNYTKTPSHDEDFRVNQLNIQMLSRSLHEQIFGEVKHDLENDKRMKESLAELKKHGLPGTLHRVDDIRLKLPKLINGNVEDHFYELGKQQSEPYKILVDCFINSIPQKPKRWRMAAGWTKYVNEEAKAIDYPEEDALIFDVEICCVEGKNPVMATAVSTKYWYSWACKDVCAKRKSMNRNKIYDDSTNDLIPIQTPSHVKGCQLGDSFFKPKVIIGHSVSFDRARIKEEYWLERSGLRFLDTMSLHIAISGVTSQQKMMLKSGAAKHENWSELTSLNNSLSAVHKFYCGQELKKEARDIFITGTLEDVAKDFQNLMTYCADDVAATHRVLTRLWPMFLERFPHPVTLAGMLELSTCYLPVNRNWRRYVENARQTFDDLNVEAKLLLAQQADKSCQLLHDGKYKRNLWLWSEKWDTKPFKLNKAKTQPQKTKPEVRRSTENEVVENKNDEIVAFDRGKTEELGDKFSTVLLESRQRIPVKIPHLTGYPEWYRKLCSAPRTTADWKPGPQLIGASMKITPKVLSLTWNFMPLHHVRAYGWCYLVPYRTNLSLPEDELAIFPLRDFVNYYLQARKRNHIERGAKPLDVDKFCQKLRDFLSECGPGPDSVHGGAIECGLIKLPHKNGADLNVGNPLARDFINKFSGLEVANGGTSTGDGDLSAVKIIEISRQLSYWKNNKDRIENQFAVWLSDRDLPTAHLRSQQIGVILPNVTVCGTLTRRAVEPTWMTASNASDERVGSELRAMIQAPPGYSVVGADVDSQELWISSLFGDSFSAKEHGCTPFSWMTLSGQKMDQTDMHSVTAKTMGISRDNAKVINYARIYGAGEKFAERLLRQFIPEIEESRSVSIARKMMQTTKGSRVFELKPEILPERKKQRSFSRAAAKQLCSLYNKEVDDLFQRPRWANGSESAMFNSLEEIACSERPETPFLGARLTNALEPAATGGHTKFMPTRINWVVQSSAVDYLHLLLVCMRWLIGPRVRFCLSFHDEVRYIVPDKQRYQVALALHVSNLLTRCFCVQRVGMRDLPQSVAFFSSVEVDTVLRKEPTQDCVTPSNPHGLSKGYGIPFGESLNISEAIQKAEGKIGNVETTAVENKS